MLFLLSFRSKRVGDYESGEVTFDFNLFDLNFRVEDIEISYSNFFRFLSPFNTKLKFFLLFLKSFLYGLFYFYFYYFYLFFVIYKKCWFSESKLVWVCLDGFLFLLFLYIITYSLYYVKFYPKIRSF